MLEEIEQLNIVAKGIDICSFINFNIFTGTLNCALFSTVCNATIPTLPLFEMFAVLSRFTLSFVYKTYIGFLSRMRAWTVGAAQHSTAQHSTAQHSTAQHSTAQHSTVNLLVN